MEAQLHQMLEGEPFLQQTQVHHWENDTLRVNEDRKTIGSIFM